MIDYLESRGVCDKGELDIPTLLFLPAVLDLRGIGFCRFMGILSNPIVLPQFCEINTFEGSVVQK